MKTLRSRTELGSALSLARLKQQSIGLVPTMGALHEGHLSLIRTAKQEVGLVVVSIFVNPTQFAPNEDFSSYPRPEEKDHALLQKEGVDIVFLPSAAELYPDGFESTVSPGPAAEGLESDFRPHFFGGVVNVVSRLFHAVSPEVAVFGEKDYQQSRVIREMVAAYHFPIRIVGSPTVRDEFGLALSSRNAYLSPQEINIARHLNKVLFETADAIREGNKAEELCAKAEQKLIYDGFDKVDYLKVRWGRVLAAVWLGKVRLIDNVSCV